MRKIPCLSLIHILGEPKAELADYVRLGGFPATHLQEFSQDEVYTIVRDIYNSTIFSDIVKRLSLIHILALPTYVCVSELV